MGNYWYGEIDSGKNVGMNFNLNKVYFVVCFYFMVWVNDKVWVSRY